MFAKEIYSAGLCYNRPTFFDGHDFLLIRTQGGSIGQIIAYNSLNLVLHFFYKGGYQGSEPPCCLQITFSYGIWPTRAFTDYLVYSILGRF